MRIGRPPETNRTRVVVLTADTAFEESARATFGASSAIELVLIAGRLAEHSDTLDVTGATVVVVDIDASRADEMNGLARLMARVGTWPPVVAVTQNFDEHVARTLLQMRTADFLVKPVEPIDLVRACARVSKGSRGGAEPTEAKIYTFLPAVGGAGRHDTCRAERDDLLNSGGPRVKPVDVSGRSRFSARLGRRLSRPRAAPQSGGNRAAARSSGQAAARRSCSRIMRQGSRSWRRPIARPRCDRSIRMW
jgi:pilus assembly protein CpaE